MPASHRTFRDSFVGQCIYYGSKRRWLQYQEELPGFEIPSDLVAPVGRRESQSSIMFSDTPDNEDTRRRSILKSEEKEHHAQVAVGAVNDRPVHPQAEESAAGREFLHPHDPEKGELARREQEDQAPVADTPYIIVGWYGPDDPECPMNWSLAKKSFVVFQICLITFSIYIGSSIYAPGIPDISRKFGISQTAASLGLTLFVVGYGIGPMFLAPLSEIPQFGRAPVYIVTLAIFVALQVPTALSKNLGALLPLRWLAGFVGSPALATGGASMMDMILPEDSAALIGLWSIAAMAGPALGPVVGGFAAQAEGWTWTIWVLLWLSGFTLIFLAFTMPETSSQAILCRRARRLRRLTGNNQFRSQGEIDGENMTLGDIGMMTLVRPFILGFREPIVFAWNIYLGLVYGILYCFISSLGIVFIEKHGFNLGQNGLAFLGIIVGVIGCYLSFLPWALFVLRPKFRNGTFVPEDRMPLAFPGAFTLPISLFWFGWTSASSIHWISPILASVLWTFSAFILFQAGLNYLVDCYPRHVASVLASNDLVRSMVGASFPLFSAPFLHNLGVGQAMSVIGGISIAMLPIPFLLHRYGARLRAMSKFAD